MNISKYIYVYVYTYICVTCIFIYVNVHELYMPVYMRIYTTQRTIIDDEPRCTHSIIIKLYSIRFDFDQDLIYLIPSLQLLFSFTLSVLLCCGIYNLHYQTQTHTQTHTHPPSKKYCCDTNYFITSLSNQTLIDDASGIHIVKLSQAPSNPR